jgi:hypothetical protein
MSPSPQCQDSMTDSAHFKPNIVPLSFGEGGLVFSKHKKSGVNSEAPTNSLMTKAQVPEYCQCHNVKQE